MKSVNKIAKLFLLLVFALLFSLPAAFACSNACSATTQYSCSLVTSSMTKSSSGTLTVSLTNKQSSAQTETATITGDWFSASTGSSQKSFNSNIPTSVAFTVTPNNAGSNSVCVNMETTGCQADCGSITIDSPASISITSVASSASSVAASGSFTVTGTIQNSGTQAAGSTSSVVAVLSGDTCTVTSGTQTVGQLGGSSSWSNAWAVTMGTTACTLTLSVSGNPGATSPITSSTTVARTAASTTTTTTSSGGGTASDAAPLETNIGAVETIILDSMPAGENKLTISKSEISWTLVTINLREAIDEQIEFKVQSLKQKPNATKETGETTYQYLFVETINIPISKILTAKIRFKIPNEYLNNNSLDAEDIVLKRYSQGEWTDLTTAKVSKNALDTIFEAEIPALDGYFAVGAKEGVAVEKAEEEEIRKAEEEEIRKEIEEAEKAAEKKSQLLLILGIVLIAALAIVLAALLYIKYSGNISGGKKK